MVAPLAPKRKWRHGRGITRPEKVTIEGKEVPVYRGSLPRHALPYQAGGTRPAKPRRERRTRRR